MADGNAGVETVNDIVLRAEVEQADLTALRDAYATIQGLPATDNRSWLHWSGYHGFDQYDCWHHDRTGPGPGTLFPYDLFLPWHRAYLVSFEHILRDQNAAAVLPWWDWTSSASHQQGIPDAFAEPQVDGNDNPLASGPIPAIEGSPAGRTERSPGNPGDLPSMTQTDPALGPGLHSINYLLKLTSYVDFSNQLQNIHDAVHGWVGGSMGVVATSAFDPIFYSHHCMIDRIWYLWQLNHGPHNIPADYLDKVLAPFNYTVQQVLDVRSLGYDYATSVAASAAGPSGAPTR
ncbi:MAG TPA: tyrosinase family protein [Solirubrobacteraceae bacterium]|nr:tyrosinase family protein [Solirubrobacteraceae bacterium]